MIHIVVRRSLPTRRALFVLICLALLLRGALPAADFSGARAERSCHSASGSECCAKTRVAPRCCCSSAPARNLPLAPGHERLDVRTPVEPLLGPRGAVQAPVLGATAWPRPPMLDRSPVPLLLLYSVLLV
jgi:hypothetical protein